MSKKEVMETKSTELALVSTDMSAWGDVVVESKDFIMPKILLQQAMSEAVKSQAAKDGDYLNTLTASVCSDKEGNVSILPFYCKQSYSISKWSGSKFIFWRTEAYVDGVVRSFEETLEGIRCKVVHNYNFFCLLEEKGLPAIVSFGSTSNYTGKRLFNLMYLSNPQQKKSPAHNWITLGRGQQSNKDNDKYFVMSIEVGRESTQEELKECLTWIPVIKQSNYKEAQEAPETSTPIVENRF